MARPRRVFLSLRTGFLESARPAGQKLACSRRSVSWEAAYFFSLAVFRASQLTERLEQARQKWRGKPARISENRKCRPRTPRRLLSLSIVTFKQKQKPHAGNQI